ncbi:hypothetical protein PPACK8108_LOCUS2369, partial [Phakopsora pachyrhizi]
MVHSTHPVNMDFSNQISGEYNNWEAEDILPLHEWDNYFKYPESVIQLESHHEFQHGKTMFPPTVYTGHSDSVNQPANFEEVQHFHPVTPWSTASVEDLSFSVPNHQRETQTHEGSSKYQTPSPNTIQPIIDEGLHDESHYNLASYFDEFWHSDHSLVPQVHQNMDIPHTEQAIGVSDYHFLQNVPPINPPISDITNRLLDDYHIQSREVFNINPESLFQNSGFINDDAKTGQLSNSIINENLIHNASKELKRKFTQAEHEAIESFKKRLDLIDILKKYFSIGPKETSKNNALSGSSVNRFLKKKKKNPELEAKYQRYIENETLKFVQEEELKEYQQPILGDSFKVEERSKKAERSAIDDRRRARLIECAFRIQWKDYQLFRKRLNDFAKYFIYPVEVTAHAGITFMKIISKNYPKVKISEEFGDEESLLQYNTNFWNLCFLDQENMKTG